MLIVRAYTHKMITHMHWTRQRMAAPPMEKEKWKLRNMLQHRIQHNHTIATKFCWFLLIKINFFLTEWIESGSNRKFNILCKQSEIRFAAAWNMKKKMEKKIIMKRMRMGASTRMWVSVFDKKHIWWRHSLSFPFTRIEFNHIQNRFQRNCWIYKHQTSNIRSSHK